MTELSVEGVTVVLGSQVILQNVSLNVPSGGFSAVVGPNGSGKTTLIRAIAGAVPLQSGRIMLGGEGLEKLNIRSLAQRIAVLRQETSLDFDFTVEEVVQMGRSPYKRLLDADGDEDRRIVEEALRITDARSLERRIFPSLSGGEKQRVLLARALAQRPALLLLDEPTNHLDIKHQLEILTAIAGLGLTVLAALHDLNSALRFAEQVVLLDRGQVRASGPAAEVLSAENIREVFGVEAERAITPGGQAVLGFRAREG